VPFSDGRQQQQNKRDKERKKKSRKSERRNEVDTSWKDAPVSEHRQPAQRRAPQTTPARFTKHRQQPTFVNADEPTDDLDLKTPRASNHRRVSKKQAKKQVMKIDEPTSFFTSSSSSRDGDDTDAGSSIASKTTEMALSALNQGISYLYPAYQQEEQNDNVPIGQSGSLTKTNAEQQKTIEELTDRLNRLTSPKDTDTGNVKLCERILAKAEADNVSFRMQIQILHAEKEAMKKAADLKEEAHQKSIKQMRKMLSEKGSEMKIAVFGGGSSSSLSSGSRGEGDDRVVVALQTVLTHMDQRNNSLHAKVSSLEADLSTSEVALKKTQSKNYLLHGEKRELERKVTILDEEKGMVQAGASDLKERLSKLTVINQSLQEQVDSLSSGQVKYENGQLQSEVKHLNAQISQLTKEKENSAQMHYNHHQVTELEEKIESLVEKNRSLKDTILMNNEKYSKKVQELGDKYSIIESANKDLRQSLAKKTSSKSDMQVHLEGESKLLYEV